MHVAFDEEDWGVAFVDAEKFARGGVEHLGDLVHRYSRP